MPNKDMKSIKNPKTYEALKRKGMSKESAAKISNAQANINHAINRGRRKR